MTFMEQLQNNCDDHEIPETEPDMVNHPSHYCRDGGMESIDEMVEVFGVDAVLSFCLCNVWKYRYRASDKNGEEDLAKSDWYMRKYVELKEKHTPKYIELKKERD